MSWNTIKVNEWSLPELCKILVFTMNPLQHSIVYESKGVYKPQSKLEQEWKSFVQLKVKLGKPFFLPVTHLLFVLNCCVCGYVCFAVTDLPYVSRETQDNPNFLGRFCSPSFTTVGKTKLTAKITVIHGSPFNQKQQNSPRIINKSIHWKHLANAIKFLRSIPSLFNSLKRYILLTSDATLCFWSPFTHWALITFWSRGPSLSWKTP